MKKVKRNNVTRNTSNNSISSNLIKKNLNGYLVEPIIANRQFRYEVTKITLWKWKIEMKHEFIISAFLAEHFQILFS